MSPLAKTLEIRTSPHILSRDVQVHPRADTRRRHSETAFQRRCRSQPSSVTPNAFDAATQWCKWGVTTPH